MISNTATLKREVGRNLQLKATYRELAVKAFEVSSIDIHLSFSLDEKAPLLQWKSPFHSSSIQRNASFGSLSHSFRERILPQLNIICRFPHFQLFSSQLYKAILIIIQTLPKITHLILPKKMKFKFNSIKKILRIITFFH